MTAARPLPDAAGSDVVAAFLRAHPAWLAEHPELTDRNRWREVGSPVGMLRALLPPGLPGGVDPRMDPVPALGEHTDFILGDLGYTPAQIAGFHQDRVV